MRSTEASLGDWTTGPACSAVDATHLSRWSTPPYPPQLRRNGLPLISDGIVRSTRQGFIGGAARRTSPSTVVFTEYELQVSSGSNNWTKSQLYRPQWRRGRGHVRAHVSCRYLRAYFMRSNKDGRHGLLEWEVYETGVPFDRREFDCLSFNMPANASSEQDRGSTAAKAVDSNSCSWWASKERVADPQWLQIDFAGQPPHCRASRSS